MLLLMKVSAVGLAPVIPLRRTSTDSVPWISVCVGWTARPM